MNGKIFAAMILAVAQAGAQPIAGRWDATIQINGVETPFPLEISGSGTNVTASLFNGTDRYVSTQGQFEQGKLVVKWDYYAATLEATLKDGVLVGQYAGTRRMKGPFAIRATRGAAAKSATASVTAPNINGVWEIPNKSGKGELAWRFVVQQSKAQQSKNSPNVSATILRVDGDTGTISGAFQNGKFVLSHFDGARAHLLEVTPAPDGTLNILQDGNTKMTAYRPVRRPGQRPPGADRPRSQHQHEGSQGTVPFQLPRSDRARHIQRGCPLPRQGCGRRDHGKLVPELS